MKTYIITGCSSGLGYALTMKLLNLGHTVVPITRNHLTHSELAHHKNCYPLMIDITSDLYPSKLENHLAYHRLTVDCIIFNAAPNIDKYHTATHSFVNDLNSAFKTIVIGHYWTFIAAKKHLNPYPTIVAVSSRLGSVSMQHSGEFNNLIRPPSYKIAKAGLNMLMGILKQENPSIRCLTVHPGLMNTKMGNESGINPMTIADRLIQEIDSPTTDNFLNLETGEAISW